MLIRMKLTGQVIDMVPAAAIAKLNAGMAEPVVEEKRELAANLFPTSVAGIFEKAAKFIGAK